jgi:hypothetical protein
MPLTIVNGLMKVSVDVREVMNGYICDKVGIDLRQYPDAKFALDDLASMLISLGKERGIKIKVTID